MAKRKEPEKPIAKDDPSRILDINMEDVMHNSMMPYAEHVILERALPRVEDGLKPVQRHHAGQAPPQMRPYRRRLPR